MTGYIDLHNHVLPGLDDGAPDLASAVALVQGLVGLGFSEIHPTPHQKARAWAPTFDERLEAVEALRAGLAEASCPVQLHQPAGENMWDDLFLERREDRSFPCYEGERAFLLEFPIGMIPPQLPERLFALRVEGRLPVIAHLERFPEIAKDRKRVEGLDGKAALTVNLSSLGGLGGWGQKRLARKLVLEGRIHAVASDAHGEPDLRFTEAGLAWLAKHLDSSELSALLIHNPRAILGGEIPD